MVIWAFFACLLVAEAGSPVREHNGYGNVGYDYDVKHPGGSSRVRVRTSGDTNKDYISDASYVNPYYAGAPNQPDEYGPYQRNYNHEPQYGRVEGRPPVYFELSKYPKPAGYQPVHSHGHYPAYERPYTTQPKRHAISQSDVDAGPLYQRNVDAPLDSEYPNSHFVQQVSVDDETTKYLPNKFEQAPLYSKPTYEPVEKVFLVPSKPDVIQQTVSDDITQYPLKNYPVLKEQVQSPIDQHVFVDEPKEIPVISQASVEEIPLLSQKVVDIPLTKSIPVAKIPIVQQSSLGDYDEVSQIAVADKPPVLQQVSDDIIVGKSYGSPVIQTAIDDHPSQAVYDSSIDPPFSDIDRQIPSHSYPERPKYQFVPSGPPYERISHSTEIIHGPHRSPYSYKAPYPKHVKSYYPVIKDYPPPIHSVKRPPPPPFHSVKLPPPPPVHSVKLPPPPPVHSVKLPPPPPVHSVKLPPPPPPSVKLLPHPPVHSVKLPPPPPSVKLPPPPPSVKLPPPPPPITKSVVPVELSQAQEHIDVIPVVLPDAQEYVDSDLILTKNPPLSQSVKIPPPPITKYIVPVELSQQQEHVDSDIILTKNPPLSQSIKLPPPPPPPVTKLVVSPVLTQAQEPADVILFKEPPIAQSVKLPPPPITKSVVPVELSQQQEHIDTDVIVEKIPPVYQSVKLPPPPVTKYVEPPVLSQVQEPVEIIVTKNPPLPHSVKLPPPVYKPPLRPSVKAPYYGHKSIGPSYVKSPPPRPQWSKPHNIYFTKNHPPPHTVKRPYNAYPVGPSHVKLPPPRSYWSKPHNVYTQHPKSPPASYSVKRPFNTAPVYPNPHLKTQSSIKVPPPVSHGVKIPATKSVHSVKTPVSVKSPPHIKTPPLTPPWIKYASSPDSIQQPYSAIPVSQDYQESSVESPFSKYPSDDGPAEVSISHGAEPSYSFPAEGLSSHSSPDVPLLVESVEESPFEKYSPVSHAVRLPPLKSQLDSPSILEDKIPSIDVVESSPFDKYPRVSHAVRLPGVLSIPTTTSVPNLFAAVPLLDDKSDPVSASLQDHHSPISHAVILPISEVSKPKASALRIDSLSHSERVPLRGSSGRFYEEDEDLDEPKQKFPAFPVESALKQKDPVSDKVADSFSNSFTPGAGYRNSNYEPESKSTEDAKIEIDRINKDIGFSFGDRLPGRSRYS